MVTEVNDYELGYLTQEPGPRALPSGFSDAVAQTVLDFHRRLPGYAETGLVRLRRLAAAWNVGDILVKDESTRFGLNAFKVLGSSYAIVRLLCRRLERPFQETDFDALSNRSAGPAADDMTFSTATDGNHGRGVAWTAQQLGYKAVVYMPKATVPPRVENIRHHGATVKVTDMNYDDTVRLASRTARDNGWTIIQDKAWEGYTDIPLWIMQGYMTMSVEAVRQMGIAGIRPSHVFVQAGVGSLPAAVIGHLSHVFGDDPPRFILLEPNNAACFLASAAGGGGPRSVSGDLATIMAGLACGEPSTLAWDILGTLADGYIRCPDYVAANGMRILANPLAGDTAVESGESGAVGIGLLDLIANHKALAGLKADLGIGPKSRILFFNTEGYTDPVNARQILWHGKCALPGKISGTCC